MLLGCVPNLKQEWRKVSIAPVSFSDSNRLRLIIESAWTDIGKAKYQGPSLYPKPIQDSDMVLFFYYLRSYISIGELSRLLGIPIFVSGPHADDSLIINDPSQFGFYHPEFPIRIRKYFIPALTNPVFRSITQSNYDRYIRNIARTFFAVYQKLNSNPSFYENETQRYSTLLREKRLDPYYLERFVLFMKPAYTDGEDLEDSAKFNSFTEDENLNEDLVKQSVGFWIRRRIDKTDYLFYQGLADLIHCYDMEYERKRLN